MTWVLVCQGLAGRVLTSQGQPVPIGWYMSGYDVEAHDGRGTCEWTSELDDALHFPTLYAAMEAWQTQSRVRPRRPDGKANRPLTAFTVEPRKV